MFLLHKTSKALLEVTSVDKLMDPFSLEIDGCLHAGEELQDLDHFLKSEFLFPSGELLPQCWVDPHYRDLKLPKISCPEKETVGSV